MRLWEKGETDILPMGYLLAGPVGTGKTFYVSCLAGEANVPVVKLKNFRDKYVGESEAKLEKIFRLLHALGRCIVFIDEADQNLGKRDSNDESGVSGRLYSMMAEEMSKPTNRGRILWILASSRPDLIEIDFKRPGRIDVKVPLFPTTTSEESYALLKGISAKKGIVLSEEDEKLLLPLIPNLMTPGEINNIGVKVQRQLRLSDGKASAAGILKEIFDDYTPPISRELLQFQIELAIKEASDMDFVPAAFLKK
jgi:SpoVK/Ycf46/Vps4 family AAA+-type ATPase